MEMKTKNPVLALFAALLLSLGLLGITPHADASLPPEGGGSGAPCTVSSFTLHAKLRMSERGISETSVRNAVRSHCRSAYWQAGTSTWMYPSTSAFLPVVVMNGSAQVVTTWWPSAGGGGGTGSW